MKFSEMTYTRPDINALLARCKQLAAKAADAQDGDALRRPAAGEEQLALAGLSFHVLPSLRFSRQHDTTSAPVRQEGRKRLRRSRRSLSGLMGRPHASSISEKVASRAEKAASSAVVGRWPAATCSAWMRMFSIFATSSSPYFCDSVSA